MSRRFLFVLGSHRSNGNTELLARRAAARLPADCEQEWISLAEYPLPDYDDLRHTTRPEEGSDLARLFEATYAATDIVIASPVYWFSLSSRTKRYLDHWTAWLYAPEVDFGAAMAGRTLWAVTASAGASSRVAEPLVGTLNNLAAYLQMNFGGVLHGTGTAPGDVLKDADALAHAGTFFAQHAPPARFPHSFARPEPDRGSAA
ncbi:NAD(P)H-dependent oxidoreductase [Streptomyces scabiei]|uniref:flavodoxin family protein n=1 Tax=Streptomyces scabiei TaxID=1930 RepID=UPI001B303BEB|nr:MULTISPECIES: NAD(P)H-dependent oxidoreductase [Streptomyces]MBP5865946.1 NAD(P)H-dependent oxidoreductase [Streptomyces sp. LBUM 1484]MBP5872652.1 NAD(P)H-dependent oxidoreductase [Streptomyces sp. LBUM 1485]MBP5873321.1 NAD(P)H-dependent oxidoreductase [Streptomyces sp. LBUM 1477]MBP5881002.1 NAD(P)H-dependent oxidoreductase [Streptomyces sp. LBUM 1487]MBP5896763.1 NAD(P)H-dependent oxidoreductase [Streptomyces sp. LBUM 1488]